MASLASTDTCKGRTCAQTAPSCQRSLGPGGAASSLPHPPTGRSATAWRCSNPQPVGPRSEGKRTHLVGANFIDDAARLAHASGTCYDYIRLLHHKPYSYIQDNFDRDPLFACIHIVSVRICLRAQLTSRDLTPDAWPLARAQSSLEHMMFASNAQALAMTL